MMHLPLIPGFQFLILSLVRCILILKCKKCIEYTGIHTVLLHMTMLHDNSVPRKTIRNSITCNVPIASNEDIECNGS